MSTPYYQDSHVTIFNADCRDVLPLIAPGTIDLVLTDPPYGIAYKALRGSNGSKMWGSERVTGDAEPFDPSPLLRFQRLIIWGGQHFASRLPDSPGWILWDKCPTGPREGFVYSHAEIAWTNLMGHVEKIPYQWEGNDRQGEPFLHPTQKPVGLMRSLIERFGVVDGITLDPFMGSGTTLRAAKDLGRRAIGIEIEERYCEIAAKRMSQLAMELVS
jgi:DNA modification methylase